MSWYDDMRSTRVDKMRGEGDEAAEAVREKRVLFTIRQRLERRSTCLCNKGA